MIARLLHEMTKSSPKGARVIPFINKVDLAGGLAQGKKIARCLLMLKHTLITRILLGQAQYSLRVKEIISPPVP
jgi:hypothetical protein